MASTTQRADPFRSERLIYRAAESPDDDAFFQAIQTEPVDFQNSNTALARPQSRKDSRQFQEHVMEKSLIGVVMCLPAPVASTAAAADAVAMAKPIPIGVIHLDRQKEDCVQHRHANIGVDVLKAYQGQGYGSEAIRWILEWGFNTAGLHRVGIQSFEYNPGATRLYQRLGFTLEGRGREMFWQHGRFWDDFQYGMLDREWREMQKAKESNKDSK